MRYTWLVYFSAVLHLAANAVLAGVSPEEARKLDGPLTPVGAERAGNAEGSIPAWTGGIKTPPPGYEVGDHHPDPYPDDPILFTISAENMPSYAANLSEGQQALLRAYPDSWRMNVYPTRRSAAYPEFVYDALKANALEAQVIPEGRGGVRNARITSAFPLPRQGVEAVWNHLLRFRGLYLERYNGQVPVTRRGRFRPILLEEEIAFPYSFNDDHPIKTRFPSLLAAFKQKVVSPGALAGFGQLTLEPWDFTSGDRNTWVYSPDLRRVFRTPFSGFDNPAPNTDGLRFADENDMFNGSPYLFDWTLKGKREIYVPYNAYRLHSNKHSYADMFQQHHLNPQLARYELHRVWVVEGTVKVLQRNPNALLLENRGHLYSRRVFYIDEDTWQIAVADNYDRSGQLWRFSEGHMINFYEVPVPWYTLEVFYELKQQRYLVTGLNNQRRAAEFDEDINPRLFGPNALDYYVR
jgi:hypothetical protein